MTVSATRTLLGLSDVARLAGVHRPVVSVWRQRAAGSGAPFPPAVKVRDGQEFFDGSAVARWLAQTGRGNNPTATEDVVAFGTITGSAVTGPATLSALTALLTLSVMAGRHLAGIGADELLDLADGLDPDDELLFGELHAVRDDLPALAGYAADLADAAFGPAAAFEQLLAGQARSPGHAATAVQPSVLRLVARIAVDLADRDGVPATYVDPTTGQSALLLAVVAEHADRSPVDVVTRASTDPAARLDRRRLRVHDVARRGLAVERDGTFAVDRAVTHVAQFPTPANPRMAAAAVLDAVDNLVLQMGAGQRGVVLASANVLTERISDPTVDGRRAAILRAGHVHAVVRLPKGLVPARSREALALWLLGPAQNETPVADRFVIVADLAEHPLTEPVVDSLVTDLAAATGSRTLARAHAFRFARFVPTRLLLTATGSLVEAGGTARTGRPVPTADLLVEIDRLRAALAARQSDALGLPTAAPGQRPSHSPVPRTIGELIDEGRLRLVPGNRIADADIGTGTGIQVLGVEELTGAAEAGSRTVDPLVLAAGYDAARLTEPGDIVFCTSPRPAAVVDRTGASVVPFPARLLRIDRTDPGGLVADVLAADIRAMPADSRQWRRWPVRRVPDGERDGLTDALSRLRTASASTRRRLHDLDALTRLLTDGVTRGSLTLQPDERPTKGR